eukprot:gene865-940_t
METEGKPPRVVIGLSYNPFCSVVAIYDWEAASEEEGAGLRVFPALPASGLLTIDHLLSYDAFQKCLEEEEVEGRGQERVLSHLNTLLGYDDQHLLLRVACQIKDGGGEDLGGQREILGVNQQGEARHYSAWHLLALLLQTLCQPAIVALASHIPATTLKQTSLALCYSGSLDGREALQAAAAEVGFGGVYFLERGSAVALALGLQTRRKEKGSTRVDVGMTVGEEEEKGDEEGGVLVVEMASHSCDLSHVLLDADSFAVTKPSLEHVSSEVLKDEEEEERELEDRLVRYLIRGPLRPLLLHLLQLSPREGQTAGQEDEEALLEIAVGEDEWRVWKRRVLAELSVHGGVSTPLALLLTAPPLPACQALESAYEELERGNSLRRRVKQEQEGCDWIELTVSAQEDKESFYQVFIPFFDRLGDRIGRFLSPRHQELEDGEEDLTRLEVQQVVVMGSGWRAFLTSEVIRRLYEKFYPQLILPSIHSFAEREESDVLVAAGLAQSLLLQRLITLTLPRTIGLLVWKQDEGEKGQEERVFEPLLLKGCELPAQATRRFTLEHVSQRQVTLDIYELEEGEDEGEEETSHSNSRAGYNLLLSGNATVKETESVARKCKEVEVIFKMSALQELSFEVRRISSSKKGEVDEEEDEGEEEQHDPHSESQSRLLFILLLALLVLYLVAKSIFTGAPSSTLTSSSSATLEL